MFRICFQCWTFHFFSSRCLLFFGRECTGEMRDNRKKLSARVMMFMPSCGGGNTERQLFHDVLIIQRKLCFSFFTVCFLESRSLRQEIRGFYTALQPLAFGRENDICIAAFFHWYCGCCAYTQWELLRSMRAHLLCAGLRFVDPLLTLKTFHSGEERMIFIRLTRQLLLVVQCAIHSRP